MHLRFLLTSYNKILHKAMRFNKLFWEIFTLITLGAPRWGDKNRGLYLSNLCKMQICDVELALSKIGGKFDNKKSYILRCPMNPYTNYPKKSYVKLHHWWACVYPFLKRRKQCKSAHYFIHIKCWKMELLLSKKFFYKKTWGHLVLHVIILYREVLRMILKFFIRSVFQQIGEGAMECVAYFY